MVPILQVRKLKLREKYLAQGHHVRRSRGKSEPTFLPYPGPLHMLFPLPRMPFSALLFGQIFSLETSVKVISSRKPSLSSQAQSLLHLSFVEPITMMTSLVEGVYSQSVPSAKPGVPGGQSPHPPYSHCVQHPA